MARRVPRSNAVLTPEWGLSGLIKKQTSFFKVNACHTDPKLMIESGFD